jgi:hypothetical protein
MNIQELSKSKTFWTGLAGVLGAVGGFFTGEATAVQAIQLGITSLLAIFLRDAMAP